MLSLDRACTRILDAELMCGCRSKLLLEKLVIKKGSVLEGDKDADKGGGLTADGLLELLKTPVDAKSDLAQSGAVDDQVGMR